MTIQISGLGAVFPDADFSLQNYAVAPKTYVDRASALALAAASLALQNAGFSGPLGEEFGLVTATQFGCVETMRAFENSLHEKGAKGASPILFSHSYFNSPAAILAIEWGIRGYHAPLVGQNSALEALELAQMILKNGDAKHVLVGAFEAKSPARIWGGEPLDSQREGAVFAVLSADSGEKNSDFAEVKSLFENLGHV